MAGFLLKTGLCRLRGDWATCRPSGEERSERPAGFSRAEPLSVQLCKCLGLGKNTQWFMTSALANYCPKGAVSYIILTKWFHSVSSEYLSFLKKHCTTLKLFI